MTTLTHDEIQCDTRSLSRWVTALASRPLWAVLFQVIVLADMATKLAKTTGECLYSCPEIEKGPGCIPETIKLGTLLSRDFRKMARVAGWLRPILGRKLLRAAEAWDDVVEDAEDIRDMIEARRDPSPGLPLEQLMAELGQCPTQ